MNMGSFVGGTASNFGGLGTAQQGVVQGMYLGTAITVYQTNSGGTTSTAGSMVQIGVVNIQARSRTLYNDGELGPLRVIRWDSLGNGQQIKVDGVLKVQCIPEGTLAPFVQNASMYSDTAHNLNAITFLAELYNGESPIRRNWTGKAYDEFMRTVFPTLSEDLVVQWNSPKLEGIAKANGWFGDALGVLKNGLKALSPVLPAIGAGLGARAGNPELGRMIGTGLASVAGSRGQFGAHGMMAGKFRKTSRASKTKKKRGRPAKNRTPSQLTAKSLSAFTASRHRSVSQAPSRLSSKRSHSSRASSAGSHKSKKRRGRKGRKGSRKGKCGGQFGAHGMMAGGFSRKSTSSRSSRGSKRSKGSRGSKASRRSRALSMPRDSKGHFIKRR
jgi:hypothetical protein